jgi:hypothetical protein
LYNLPSSMWSTYIVYWVASAASKQA